MQISVMQVPLVTVLLLEIVYSLTPWRKTLVTLRKVRGRMFRIFGDGAYALRPWLITPFDARELREDGAARDVFNLQH